MTETARRPLPALTGVRFFAAMAVLLFHYGAGFSERIHAPYAVSHFLHNGFLGVSLFFVLSGFIITYSHFSEKMTVGVVARFYWARVARIYPIYLLALLLALPVLTAPLAPLDALSVLTMTQAWTFPASHHGFAWVMQAWTLSIEAVFYLLFPFYWPLVRRLSQTWTIILALACAAVIIAFGVPTIGPGLERVPLLGSGVRVPIPVFRLAEFTYGMAICQMFMRSTGTLRGHIADCIELGLATAMVATLATADSPQAKAVFTVLTGILILVTAHGAGIVSRILSTRLLLLLGGASYALYILQQPVRSLCGLLLRAPYDQVVSPVATLIVAVGAFLLIEQPARRMLLRIVRRVA